MALAARFRRADGRPVRRRLTRPLALCLLLVAAAGLAGCVTAAHMDAPGLPYNHAVPAGFPSSIRVVGEPRRTFEAQSAEILPKWPRPPGMARAICWPSPEVPLAGCSKPVPSSAGAMPALVAASGHRSGGGSDAAVRFAIFIV